jgi:ribose/xylose/arabinose/galactoside ABC-type transport system permease subunit
MLGEALRQSRPNAASLRGFALLAVLLAVLFAASGTISLHLALDNVRQAAPLGVIVIGQAIVLMMGRIDLSVGATASIANIVLSMAFANRMENAVPALAATFAVAIAVGVANGVMATRLRIPSFLATLATALVLRGAMLVITGGSPKGGIPEGFRIITESWAGPVPISALIWLAVALLMGILVHFTVTGRKMLIAGSNPVAARFNGIPADGLVILAFVLCAVLAALGGTLLSAITGMATIGVGEIYTLDSIAAAVIGGALFTGGVFAPAGAIAGTLILFFLQSLLYLLALPVAGKFILQGGIIVLALALANLRKGARG